MKYNKKEIEKIKKGIVKLYGKEWLKKLGEALCK